MLYLIIVLRHEIQGKIYLRRLIEMKSLLIALFVAALFVIIGAVCGEMVKQEIVEIQAMIF
jgi:hypothetical protein